MKAITDGFNKIINLFKVFVELYKYKCSDSIFSFSLFFERLIGNSIELYMNCEKIGINKEILRKIFDCNDAITINKSRFVINLNNYSRVNANFELKYIDISLLDNCNYITKTEKENIRNLFRKNFKEVLIDEYIGVVIKNKQKNIYLIEINLLNRELFNKISNNYDLYFKEEFTNTFKELINRQLNDLFANYYVDIHDIISKHKKIKRKRIVIKFLLDQNLKNGDYFADVMIGYYEDHEYKYINDEPDNYLQLTEICFDYDENKSYEIIDNIGNMLSEKVYYLHEDNCAVIYIDIEYTYKDLLDFTKYLIYVDSIFSI